MVSRKIRETLQTVLNTAVTPACLLAVLAIWPVSNLVRALRSSAPRHSEAALR